MAHQALAVALSMFAAIAPAAASQSDPMPPMAPAMAPAAGDDARYCLRIEAVTGTRLEQVRCWTRQQWAEREVDVDQEWAKEGVAIISDGVIRPARG